MFFLFIEKPSKWGFTGPLFSKIIGKLPREQLLILHHEKAPSEIRSSCFRILLEFVSHRNKCVRFISIETWRAIKERQYKLIIYAFWNTIQFTDAIASNLHCNIYCWIRRFDEFIEKSKVYTYRYLLRLVNNDTFAINYIK